MKVHRLPVDPGTAAWNAILPVAAPRPALEEKMTADWLVIGAGFAGLSAARRLAELHPADRIVVLEASRVAEGPAGRNSGFMIDVPHDLTSSDYSGHTDNDHRAIRLNRAGIAYALEARDRWSLDAAIIAQSGKVNGAITSRGVRHNDGYARHLQHLDEPFERLDAQAMHELTGTQCYIDGLYSPGTVMLQPAAYIRALAAGIESNRVLIREISPVTSLERIGPDWIAATPSGAVVAPRVILGVNGHLQSFGYYQRQLMHVFTYASMTRALSTAETATLGGSANWSLTPADPLGTSVRRISGTGGDRILTRNRATFDPSMEVDDARLTSVARTHERSFTRRFPMLASVTMDYCWGGRLCLSRNNVSVFGEIDAGLFSACCQNGLGTAKGTISGKLAAELASGVASRLLDDQLADAQPTRLPPEPIASWGAKAVLRWGEFRAGAEL